MKYKLLVYTRAFNAEKTLRRTVDSILNQTFTNFQYCLVDNGSNDKTREIILEYASKDFRIIPLLYNENRVRTSLEIISILSNNHSWDYFITLDADDEYKKDCFFKLIDFAQENNLDIVACGTDWINEKTGEIIKHKVIDKNIILQGQRFADDFTEYRNYMVTVWGELYSLNLLKKCSIEWSYKAMNFADTAFAMEAFRKAKRAGVFAESLHKYYISSKTDSYKYNPKWFYACKNLIEISKEYLLDYGEISKKNEDYLYVLLLILIKYILPRIQNAEIDLPEKLKCLNEIFSDKMTQHILKYWYEVGIYSDKGEFLRYIHEWIKSQDGWEKECSTVEKIISLMNI